MRVIGRQFLTNRFAVAHEQGENRRIGSGFATDALGNLCHRNRGQRRFLGSLPNGGITADSGQRRVPRPDRDWKIESADHGNDTERMPLLHQTVTGPFRLNRQAIKHARLTDSEIADVDHLLHFAFAFRDNFAGLERNELTEIVLEIAQRVTETANGIAANRSGRDAPFQKCFMRATDRPVRSLPPTRCGREPAPSRRSAKSFQ